MRGEFFGRYLDDHCRSGTWSKSFLTMVEDLLSDAADVDLILPLDADEIRNTVLSARIALDEVKVPQLVLWDLHPGNIQVNNGNVSGILDCDRALWGDPLMEWFFRSIADSNQDFKSAYPNVGGLLDRPGAPLCMWLYDLYLAMVMLIECRFREFSETHVHWAENEFRRVMKNAGGFRLR